MTTDRGGKPDLAAEGVGPDQEVAPVHDGEQEVPGRETADGESPDPGEPVDVADVSIETPTGCDQAGCPGWPCTENDECVFPYCLETPEGSFCAKQCTEGSPCPPGYTCERVASYPDVMFACVHKAPRTCQPCSTAEECKPDYAVAEMMCVRLEFAFSCLPRCMEASECDPGFHCADVGDGNSACVPDEGACPCSEKYVKLGVKGLCEIENEYGTCPGEFTCLADGRGPCEGTPAAPEACNATDDDCDGQTDEGFVSNAECDLTNVYGTCKGTNVCLYGQEICQGSYAVPEVCNGIDDDCDGGTDEESGDIDIDGIADCVDPDMDGDGVKNEADNCPFVPNLDQADNDKDEQGDACDADDDDDGYIDTKDDCPLVDNPDQRDTDHDGTGDACDCDMDGDSVLNVNPGCKKPTQEDNCPYDANPTQLDSNGNGVGDACDADLDGDGVANTTDNCPTIANADQKDLDKDGVGDACSCDIDGDGVDNTGPGCPACAPACDNCPTVENPSQSDINQNGTGDACDPDKDGDGHPNADDNCPGTWNPDQKDTDLDGTGDACEADWDGDTIPNADDNCPQMYNAKQEDLDLDGDGDACDCDVDGDGVGNTGMAADNTPCPLPRKPDNCLTVTNPGQEDLDGDGRGNACDEDIDGDLDLNQTDCAPFDATSHHAANESCNGKDDNCNGGTDEENATNCTVWHVDADKDGYGTFAAACLCAPANPYTAKDAGDCNDSDPSVSPATKEVCGNFKDDDCDASVDEPDATGCVSYHKDLDGDGYGVAGDAQCLCAPGGGYVAVRTGDCNDADKAVFPGQMESCNGRDDDCDTVLDPPNSQNCKVFFLDADRDGFGVDNDKQCLCSPIPPYDATKWGDCDDDSASAHPYGAEVCNTVDDDCDGSTDEKGATGCTRFYLDADGDSYGVPLSFECLCGPAAPFTASTTTDCNDSDPNVHPTAPEACNYADDDCNGKADDPGATGCKDWYFDGDVDGFGAADKSQCLCQPNGQYTAANGLDCNDADKNAYPGAVEFCNSRDDDCDAVTDEEDAANCKPYYRDSDADSYGVQTSSKCQCGPAGEWSTQTIGDCDDGAPSVHPGAAEACNGTDDNCNGTLDDEGASGCTQFYIDSDHDGFGAAIGGKCLCAASGLYTALNNADCNDANADVKPGAPERCNFVDDNCNGQVDEDGAIDQSPCGGCQTTCELPVGSGQQDPFDPTPENSDGVTKDPANGSLTLNASKVELPYIWIANSPDGTVSKVNTRTLKEEARYSVCSDPSRTAVDLNGNGIITCRGDGKIAKVAIYKQDCVDRNNNGTIQTSSDLNGDGKIGPGEMVTGMVDECVLWIAQPDGANGLARAAGVDADNNIWVGMWNTRRLWKLSSADGSTLAKWQINNSPYGLAIDKNGTIWVSSRSACVLEKVSPISGSLAVYTPPKTCPYGIAVDPYGKVWLASWENHQVHRFDPSSSSWMTFSAPWARGVAISVLRDASGNVNGSKVYVAGSVNWSSCTAVSHVSVVDAKTLQVESQIPLGKDCPVGVAVDVDGYLWSVNWSSNSAHKIDTTTKQIVGTVPVGRNPYTYSDMTGYAAKSIVTTNGHYRQVFKGWDTFQTYWVNVSASADLPGGGKTYLKFRFRTAATEADLAAAPWSPESAPIYNTNQAVPVSLTGKFLEVEVGMFTNDPNYLPRLWNVVATAQAK